MNDQSAFRTVLPDADAIARHLDFLFGYLDGFVPIRLIPEKGTPARPIVSRYLHAHDPALTGFVQQAAEQAGRDRMALFVVPAVVAAAGRAHADDVVGSGALLVDLDKGDIGAQREHLVRHVGLPSMVVASGGLTDAGQAKLHLYWRLTEAATGGELPRLSSLRAEIARTVGGDTSFASLHQPIRVAGTVHGKFGRKAPVRILEDTRLEYELADLAERLAETPRWPGLAGEQEAAGRGRAAGQGLSAAETMGRRFREGGQDGQSRYLAISKVIGHWIRMMRLGRASGDEAWQAVDEFNASCIRPPWRADRLRREFEALLRVDERNHGAAAGSAEDKEDAPAPLDESEDFLAAAFVAACGGTWRHVATWGVWLRWSGTRWQRDDTQAVREAVRQVCRRAAARPGMAAGIARRIASEKTIRAVERLSAADPRVATRVEDWDAEGHLLNTPGGILHLETGEVIRHEPCYLLTEITGASPGSGCPLWLTFLGEIVGGDAALSAYLQRLAGYCLTASTEEQVFAFLYGTGANGKSVFLQTISTVLGSYAATAPLSAFTATRTDAHPTDLAGLVGKRLVTVSETEPGRAWAESRIKTVTGGDRIRARFLHRDFFEFSPTFKLLVAGNHRPRLTGVGEAMRRRMHLIPFEVTIPPARRDKQLGARLLEERDGILGWMLEGYVEWREKGLAPPPSVAQSAEEYFADEDLIGQWIDEACVTGPERRAPSRQLFASWSEWARAAGAESGSQKSLGDALRERGFGSRKFAGQRGWVGIGLRRVSAGNGGAAG